MDNFLLVLFGELVSLLAPAPLILGNLATGHIELASKHYIRKNRFYLFIYLFTTRWVNVTVYNHV